ncbi:hypothetical protein FE257_009267 [Aspergillus nanangensis]|uniref:Uncharacterized protein n=1 Tax=Aspergillus nanangensis TaxID=2582783 RepID=A0AAD4GT05_ASPNN|nr:hypothetical protein FE257_009267 [Aspergillus nanangensis]
MLTSSPTESSTSSYTDSPISQHPPVHVWPSLPRAQRAEIPKAPRYYATPLKNDSPDSIPTQLYGLEEREPSICERPKLMHRFSHALGDIKEDFSLQLDPRSTTEKLRSSRRLSTFVVDSPTSSSPSTSPMGLPRTSAPDSLLGVPMETVPPRSASSRSLAVSSSSSDTPVRRLTRRLSISLSFSSRRRSFRPPQNASISQPNLIGSSTQI